MVDRRRRRLGPFRAKEDEVAGHELGPSDAVLGGARHAGGRALVDRVVEVHLHDPPVEARAVEAAVGLPAVG